MKKIFKKTAEWIKIILWMIFNPRFLICFALGWMITNGWSYVALGIGVYYKIEWLTALASGYLALLWIPATPEKLLTAALALFFLKIFFPKDEKTLGILKEIMTKTKKNLKKHKEIQK